MNVNINNSNGKQNTVYLLCGKVGSGKSTYASILEKEISSSGQQAFVLSVDDLMLRLFDECLGPERHQDFLARCKGFLYSQAKQLLLMGIDIILDFGFWSKAERTSVIQQFTDDNVECKLVLIDTEYDTITQNLKNRNKLIEGGEIRAYHIDEEKRNRFDGFFQYPDKDELYQRVQTNLN